MSVLGTELGSLKEQLALLTNESALRSSFVFIIIVFLVLLLLKKVYTVYLLHVFKRIEKIQIMYNHCMV